MHLTNRILPGIICALMATTSQASGFRLPESSITGMSASNAMVADTTTAGAAFYNPATIAFHNGFVEMNFIGLKPDMTVTPTSGRHTESQTNDWHLIPSFYFAKRLTSNISAGLGLDSPFGLETDWPTSTFPLLSTGQHPRLSQLKMLNIAPSIAYRITPDTSISAGINYYHLARLAFNTDKLTITGNGEGYGYNLAGLHKIGPVSIGLAYRSTVENDIRGSHSFSGIETPAKLELDLPWTAQIGANWAINDHWSVEFDIDRTGWNRFNKLAINKANGGGNLITSTNTWQNANAYRLGGTYRSGNTTTWRAGYTYDETGQPDATFNPRLADSDRHLFSIGFERNMGDWKLQGGYMHVRFKDRTISANPYRGSYESSANLIGLGFNVPL